VGQQKAGGTDIIARFQDFLLRGGEKIFTDAAWLGGVAVEWSDFASSMQNKRRYSVRMRLHYSMPGGPGYTEA
jgi:hypothetical protein